MMNRGSCWHFATLVILSFSAFGDAYGDDDAKRFLGTWEYVSATYEGKPIDECKDATVTITEDSWTFVRNEKTIRSTWEIDSTKSPKWLTRLTRGGKVNFLENSIYKFDGEQLLICESAYLDGRRPERFVAGEGDGQYVIVLRRKDTKAQTEPND